MHNISQHPFVYVLLIARSDQDRWKLPDL